MLNEEGGEAPWQATWAELARGLPLATTKCKNAKKGGGLLRQKLRYWLWVLIALAINLATVASICADVGGGG